MIRVVLKGLAGRPVRTVLTTLAIVVGISTTFGRVWAMGLLAAMVIPVLVIHAWWLPRQGINGWTGEPREKYYRLRGWDVPRGR